MTLAMWFFAVGSLAAIFGNRPAASIAVWVASLIVACFFCGRRSWRRWRSTSR